MLRATADGVTIAVRAQPGAKKTAIAGIYGEGAAAQLKIAVNAPPIEGRANEVLVDLLADHLSIPRSRIVLLSGETSRSKVFLFRGAVMTQVQSALKGYLK